MYFSLHVDDDIELQLLEDDHAEALFRIVDDCRDHLDPWLPWVRNNTQVEDSERFIRTARSNWGAGRAVQTAITWRGELCGVLGIKFEGIAGDVGYWIHPDNEGKGIVTRSCRTLIDYTFSHYGMHRCVIRAAPENKRSTAIPERLGFTHEGTLREAGPHPDGPFDLRLYALLRSEWEESW
jgi:ribosomal-protein-serine acetyltransferase